MRILVRPSWFKRLKLMSWCHSKLREGYRKAACFCCQLVTVSDKDLWKLMIGLIILLILFVGILLVLMRDPCNSAKIKEQLCQDYQQGLVAGSLCYDLCVTNSFFLPRCLSKHQDTLTFQWAKSMGKLSLAASTHSSATSYSEDSKLPRHIIHLEGRLSQEQLHKMISDLLTSKLGHIDLTLIIDKLYEFADVNHDGKLNFGEANSIWELLHSHEFFVLFLFQGDSVFPLINGTCGSLFTYERIHIPKLFDKGNKGFLDKFFSNTYRWAFPNWDKRANIAVGLLEYVTSLAESANSQFYMCNIQSTKFGYTERFETRLTAFDEITSQHSLEEKIRGKSCHDNRECIVGNDCMTICDSSSKSCTGVLKYPTLVHVCRVLKDYILFDAPDEVKVTLEVLLTQCSQLQNDKHSSQVMKHNLILNELTSLLWDQVKSKPVNWLDPQKYKKARIR